MKEDTELHDIIRVIYDGHVDEPKVSAAWIATEAMKKIQFPRELHALGYRGCHMHFRQIARSFLAKHFDPEETEEDDLFPETLQHRYPSATVGEGGERTYVLLDLLTEDDWLHNVTRLATEARAKQRHSDSLLAWGRRKFSKAQANG